MKLKKNWLTYLKNDPNVLEFWEIDVDNMTLEFTDPDWFPDLIDWCTIDVRDEKIDICVNWYEMFYDDERISKEDLEQWEEEEVSDVYDHKDFPKDVLDEYEIPKFEEVLFKGGIDNIVRWLTETAWVGVAGGLVAMNYRIPTIEEYEENISDNT